MSENPKLGYTKIKAYPPTIDLTDIKIRRSNRSRFDLQITCRVTVETLTENGKKALKNALFKALEKTYGVSGFKNANVATSQYYVTLRFNRNPNHSDQQLSEIFENERKGLSTISLPNK